MTSNKVGRPTKYKPDYAEALIAHMKEGRSFETFGALVGAGSSTLYLWCENQPEFMEAKNIGTILSMHWWEERMRETLITQDGIKFNTTGWIFTMKCRFPQFWSEKQEVSHVIDDRREIKSLSNTELRQLFLESADETKKA